MGAGYRWAGAWRRLRLGTRLALALGALALVVFAIVGVVTVGIMKDYLARRLDEQLTKSQLDQVVQLRNPDGSPRGVYSWYTAVYQVRDGFAAAKPGANLPADPGALAQTARDATGTEVLRTVYLHGQGTYRVRACPIAQGQVLVSAAPLGDLDSTVGQLELAEVVAFAIALAALVIGGYTVLRKGLRPLKAMASTAHDITTRDLTDSANLPVRAAGSGGGAEVRELRTAFNLMLAHIDSSLAARTAVNERLRRFVADASHELRTPLTSIRGYADLFRYAAANEPGERDAHLAKIREETARMSLLVDDLLLLARLDSTEPETPIRLTDTDPGALATDAAQAFSAAYPDHPLELAVEPDIPAVRADPGRLRQVLDNLLTNAAVHTPPGTRVTLSAGRSGNGVALRVADTGPGISAGEQERIFDRFYRVDDSRSRGGTGGGSGLGLSVVRSLVTAHGGTVTVHSRPGETIFTVSLPTGGVVSVAGG
jgi:two-component system OmpR family sensor kinase